jgi:predicted transcriptional regulator
MGWLWSGRGKPRSRPRVSRAIVEARAAHTGVTEDLGGATAVMERAFWAHTSPPPNQFPPSRGGWNMPTGDVEDRASLGVSVAGGTHARRHDFGDVGLLLERAEDTARKLGRSRAQMWEEALRAWLESQQAEASDGEGAQGAGEVARPAPRPWLFEARRQRVWSEIDETLGALRSA